MPVVLPSMVVSNDIIILSVLCIRHRRGLHAGMVEVTLVRGGEGSLTDPSSDLLVHRQVSLTSSAFPIRGNMHSYPLPTQWTYKLHEYGACTGTFHLSAVGSTAVMEAPIDWGSLEALHAPSEICESLVTTQLGRQVVRVTPQWQTPPGRPVLGRGALLLSQLLQQEPELPGPPP